MSEGLDLCGSSPEANRRCFGGQMVHYFIVWHHLMYVSNTVTGAFEHLSIQQIINILTFRGNPSLTAHDPTAFNPMSFPTIALACTIFLRRRILSTAKVQKALWINGRAHAKFPNNEKPHIVFTPGMSNTALEAELAAIAKQEAILDPHEPMSTPA
ncbi:hypothetical protein BU17DRAFT_64915 [Hysterangium stoloniferum]|nr:hypothetical protein BU17DRAFT_64915 [Hysterangium stoloniferum]